MNFASLDSAEVVYSSDPVTGAMAQGAISEMTPDANFVSQHQTSVGAPTRGSERVR